MKLRCELGIMNLSHTMIKFHSIRMIAKKTVIFQIKTRKSRSIKYYKIPKLLYKRKWIWQEAAVLWVSVRRLFFRTARSMRRVKEQQMCWTCLEARISNLSIVRKQHWITLKYKSDSLGWALFRALGVSWSSKDHEFIPIHPNPRKNHPNMETRLIKNGIMQRTFSSGN